MAFLRAQRYVIALVLASFICGMILGVTLITNTDLGTAWLGQDVRKGDHFKLRSTNNPTLKTDRKDDGENDVQKFTINSANKDSSWIHSVASDSFIGAHVSYDVHIFYYPWYGNPGNDGSFLHWNHEYLPHWDQEENAKWPKGQHNPPDDIGASFYPELGPYSSRDPNTIDNHMQQIRSAGIGVLAVSWYPPQQSDNQGHPWDDLMTLLMDVAHKYNLKVCFHIEPYTERNQRNLRENLEYIMHKYGDHPAFYRRLFQGKQLPLYYIYDSYMISKKAWSEIFRKDGAFTVRDTDLDGIFIGLVVERKHQMELQSAGFDGMYTYFASDGFSYGSTITNWPTLASYAKAANMLFIPSIGPGYNDERVRPWNKKNTKDREGGGYYEHRFQTGVHVKTDLLSITSFNEWHEGTQIEKAVPSQTNTFRYLDYAPKESDLYLSLTRKWVLKYMKMKR